MSYQSRKLYKFFEATNCRSYNTHGFHKILAFCENIFAFLLNFRILRKNAKIFGRIKQTFFAKFRFVFAYLFSRNFAKKFAKGNRKFSHFFAKLFVRWKPFYFIWQKKQVLKDVKDHIHKHQKDIRVVCRRMPEKRDMIEKMRIISCMSRFFRF